MRKFTGRHRAVEASPRRRALARGGSALPAAGIAVAGAALLGVTPMVANSPALMAQVHYLPGTKIGDFRPEAEYVTFADAMITGSGVTGSTPDYIDYPGGFWPVSVGGLGDPTYDNSVDIGLGKLNAAHPGDGDVIFGYSQGAVVASKYKASDPNTNITYVLVENPNRPNGGILERFHGLYIPILDVSFNGATADTGAPTIDISRQYDGWSDFPTYPLNALATANAIAGIILLHGNTQNIVDPAVLTDIKNDGDPMYYQQHGSSTYYVIPSAQLPLLMPLNGIVPASILDALDAPLRAIIELGYDRTDYSASTPFKLIPALSPVAPAATPSTAPDKTPSPTAAKADAPKAQAPRSEARPRPAKVVSPVAATAQRPALPKPVRSVLKALTPKKSAGASAKRPTTDLGPTNPADTAKD